MKKKYDEVDEEYEGFQEDHTSIKVMLLSQLVIFLIIFLVIGGLYLWKSTDYSNVFLPGTTINQLSCDNLTAEQVESRLAEQIEQYDLTLIFKNNEKAVIAGSDIEYEYVSSGEVEKILKEQNTLMWVVGFFQEKEYNVGSDITFNLTKLQNEIEKIGSEMEIVEEMPQGAYIQYKDGVFEIMDEVEGSALNDTIFKNEVILAVRESKLVLDVEEAGAYIKPEYTTDSELLHQQIEQLNNLASAKITYSLPTKEVILDGSIIMTWLDQDEEGNYYKDKDNFKKKVKEYVKELAEEVDSVGKDKEFLTTSGHSVNISVGTYGWKIDQQKEVEALYKNIENRDVVTREPEYSSREKHLLNNGLGFTYVEVNLTEQHLYYYEDGEIILDTNIVSGKMTEDWYTPQGIYFLQSKEKNHMIEGAMYVEGKYVTSQKAQYWMELGKNFGMHAAPWCAAFGGTYYEYNGSYGTIYLPTDKAEALYKKLKDDTPIVCVYNESYKLRPSEPMPTPEPTPEPTPIPTVDPSQTQSIMSTIRSFFSNIF